MEAKVDSVHPTLVFPSNVEVPDGSPGWHAMTFAITHAGNLAILRVNFDVWAPYRAAQRRGEGWKHFPAPSDALAMIEVFDGIDVSASPAFPLRHHPFCRFDQLPNKSWVVTGIEADESAPNAQLIAHDGRETQLRLGDDIDHLQSDSEEGFWIGYGDMGCSSPGVHGMENGGLVHFSGAGTPTWAFNAENASIKRSRIDMVETLNVSSQGTYAYIWPNFNIVKLHNGRPVFLRTRTDHADAFAVDDGRFLLVGGYSYQSTGDSDRVVLLEPPTVKGSRRLHRAWQARFDRPPLEHSDLLVGRGHTIHLVSKGRWSRLTLTEADDQVRSARVF